MNQETHLDIVEAKESIVRAQQRLRDNLFGSSHVHMGHAVMVLDRILGRERPGDSTGTD